MPDTPLEHENTSGLVDPLIGRVLAGRFRILECIAQGGMGRIYRAEQAPLGRTVAVKVLHLDARNQDDGNFRERFFREASVCARLTHPNTVRIFDYGTDNGVYFIAMEYLEGRTLNDLIRKEGPLSIDRTITIARQICRSLEQAHGQGVIHRDLKPANVFLAAHGPDEFVKVLDFGLVKAVDSKSHVTQTGNILGSPAYMSPEQVLGTPVTGRADVYALGVILYACVTRNLPFKRDNPLAVLNAQAHAEPPPFSKTAPDLDIPCSLEWVVMRCLEKKPEDRLASMAELERALKLVDMELHGSLEGFDWQLTDGRLDLPPGIEDSGIERTPRPSPTPSTAVQDAPSSPTLNTQPDSGRPVKKFVLAAVIVLLLGFGAMLALAVGFFVALQPEPLEPTEPVPAEVEVVAEPPVDIAAELGFEPSETSEASEDVGSEASEDVGSEAPVELTETKKATPKTTRKTTSNRGRGTTTKRSPTTGTTGTSTTSEDPPVEPPDEAGEGQDPEQDPDDWGSVKPASDLKDPWAD
ncbi:MAG TPA: serine/threonine-protein kinase [Myxococcota bacterium]|nr:serine/threonine-protein kinase [Myxococcota bacterium]